MIQASKSVIIYQANYEKILSNQIDDYFIVVMY